MKENEYELFIFSNLPTMNQISDQNFPYISNLLSSKISSTKKVFLIFWMIVMVLFFLWFVIIYPIMLKLKIKIHDTLVLFTKIPIKDVL